MASLTPSEVTQYHSQGFVVPQYRLSTEWVGRLQLALDSLIKNNPGVRPEKLVSAHLQGQSQAGINDEGVRGSQDFLDLAMHSDIVDLVTHVLGQTGVPVSFATWPLWLLRGEDKTGQNDFHVGHRVKSK